MIRRSEVGDTEHFEFKGQDIIENMAGSSVDTLLQQARQEGVKPSEFARGMEDLLMMFFCKYFKVEGAKNKAAFEKLVRALLDEAIEVGRSKQTLLQIPDLAQNQRQELKVHLNGLITEGLSAGFHSSEAIPPDAPTEDIFDELAQKIIAIGMKLRDMLQESSPPPEELDAARHLFSTFVYAAFNIGGLRAHTDVVAEPEPVSKERKRIKERTKRTTQA